MDDCQYKACCIASSSVLSLVSLVQLCWSYISLSLFDWRAANNVQRVSFLIAAGAAAYIHRHLWLVLVIVCMWRRSLFLLALLQESSSSPHRHWCRSLLSLASLAGPLSLVACGAVVSFHRRRCTSITVRPQIICIIVISLEAQQSHIILDYRFLHSKFVKASVCSVVLSQEWRDFLGKSLYYYCYYYYIEMHGCLQSRLARSSVLVRSVYKFSDGPSLPGNTVI
ncbi:hypothetical protein MIR68_010224 [Amoeboaphelidium protococcarum]|nr:hypothetical protein MIR68_010224 [Amoeboaphelidium protococcarum]